MAALQHVTEAAREIRKAVVRQHLTGTNIGAAMSVADILAVLYFEVMDYPGPDDPARDRLVLSKGHSAAALYGALALKGVIEPELLSTYRQDGSPLCAHPVYGALAGVEASTGSLGHGLPIAAGMADALRRDGEGQRVFVVMGDGECQEGSVWEGAILAASLELDNLTAIVDANDLQGYGRTSRLLQRDRIADVFRSFGWDAVDVDGHDVEGLEAALSAPRDGRPRAVVAKTIKGRGVAEMEDTLGWHYFNVPEEKLDRFLAELDGGGATDEP